MPGASAQELKSQLFSDGTVLLSIPESFMDESDFDWLESLTLQLPYEHVDVGDAGEPNNVSVGRFMTDVEAPELVNRPISDEAHKIVTRPKYLEFLKELFDLEEVHIRRMQINAMKPGSFVGHHLDVDSNPDYIAAIVLQMGEDFTGGEFIVHGGGRPPRHFSPFYKSMTVSLCEFPHEVTKVESGERRSLVYFVSSHNGPNRRSAK